jgi:hypothetical protein
MVQLGEPAGKGIMSKTKTPRQKKIREEETKRLKNKLVRVISNAGLAYSSWIALVELVDSIPGFDTAAWVYNDKTKQEHIWFSRKLVKSLTVELLKLILRHEMLHKSMYRGLMAVGNKELLNFALDTCINKILWLSDPAGMIKLGDAVWPDPKTRPNVMAIMNPSITTAERHAMEPRIQAIYDRIWWKSMKGYHNGVPVDKGETCRDYWEGTGTFGNDFVPDALNLYNLLAALLNAEDKKKIEEKYKFLSMGKKGGQGDKGKKKGKGQGQGQGGGKPKKGGKHVRGGRFRFRANDKGTLQGEKGVADQVLDEIRKQHEKIKSSGRGGGYSTLENLQDFFQQHIYNKTEADVRDLNDFIKRMETWKQVEGVTTNIYKNFKARTTIQPYPHRLTRIGFELVALGFNKIVPLYFNKIFSDQGGKKKVCCYFDTSPSMHSFIPYVVWMAEFFDNCEECEIAGGKYRGRYGFSGTVKGIPMEAWEDFKNGRVRGGCSTSFEAVMKHACDRIENDDVDVVLVFTDGESGLSDATIERFNQSGKKCYAIYFAHKFGYNHSRYGQDENAGMTSDLDKLNGDSFTIWCGDLGDLDV